MKNGYEIYQLKRSEQTRFLWFEPFRTLKKMGEQVNRQHYACVYQADFKDKAAGGDVNRILEALYVQFNTQRPVGFRGHSLSVSDVVVLHQEGSERAFYVDSYGFKEIEHFKEEENYLKNAELAMEDDCGMIDGIINNGRKEEHKDHGERKGAKIKKKDEEMEI